jgi:hypothetical protein
MFYCIMNYFLALDIYMCEVSSKEIAKEKIFIILLKNSTMLILSAMILWKTLHFGSKSLKKRERAEQRKE